MLGVLQPSQSSAVVNSIGRLICSIRVLIIPFARANIFVLKFRNKNKFSKFQNKNVIGAKSHGDPRFSKDNKKSKKNFMKGKKKFKRILSCLFGARRKVQVTNLPSRTSSLLSVLLRTRSAQRLSLQHFAAVPTPNIAELVPSGFFCPQPWFLRRSEHIFPAKT